MRSIFNILCVVTMLAMTLTACGGGGAAAEPIEIAGPEGAPSVLLIPSDTTFPANDFAQFAAIMTFPKAVDGLMSVLNGNPGTAILQLRDTFYLVFPQGSNYGVFIINQAGTTSATIPEQVRNTPYTPFTFNNLWKYVMSEGGRQILKEQLPNNIRLAVEEFKALIRGSAASMKMIPIFIFPAPIIPSELRNDLQS